MNTFVCITDKLSFLLKAFGAFALSSMMFIVVIDVVGRFFKHPIFGSVEIVSFLAALTIATALPFAYKENVHISVEIIVRLFSKKTQLIFEISTRLLTLILFVLITWQMLIYAKDMYEAKEVSMNLEIPVYYIICLFSFCFLIFCTEIIKSIFKNLEQLSKTK